MIILGIVGLMITFGLSLVYAGYEGIREAYLYFFSNNDNNKDKQGNKIELHPTFYKQRIIYLLLPILSGLTNWKLLIPLIINALAMALAFSYMHDGNYYVKRKELDNKLYPEGFKAESTTSTAEQEYGYKERLNMFSFSIIIHIGSIICFICLNN